MSEPAYLLGLYLHLAAASQRRNRLFVRDRFLMIAGMIATRMQLDSISAYCRRLILQHNPGHMLRRWRSIGEALDAEDFQHLLRQAQRRYPQERAERLLSQLGIDMARERKTYFSDAEYAASLLGVSIEQVDDVFGKE